MAYGFDHTSHAPIVVLWWRGETSREALKACLVELVTVFEGWTTPGRIIFDFSEVEGFDAELRRLLASWRATNRALIQEKVGAAAYVVTSRVVRGYMTAVDWLRPNRGLVKKVFSDRTSAVAWLEDEA
ncbi:MAG: STAS/SEC14 domain-containing protein [Myxococcota bacterium]